MARQFLLLILLTLGAYSLQAQGYRWRPQIHELSVEPVALRWVPAYSEGYETLPMGIHIPRALRYVYNLDFKHAIRLTVFRQQTRFNSPIEAQRTENGIAAGYAYKYTQGKNQVQLGGDAIVAPGQVEWDNPLGLGGTQQSAYQSFGIQGFAAARHYFTQHLSLTGEAALGYLSHTYNTSPAEITSPDYDIAFSPSELYLTGSIYLTVHFGKMKAKKCSCP